MSAVKYNESELISRTRAADPQAYEYLINHFQERVTRVLFPILKNPMDVEEVAQDVFLTVFAKIDQFRQVSSLATWIHRIAVNAALMRKRRQKTTDISLDDDAMPPFDALGRIEGEINDWSQLLDDPALRRENRMVIEAAIDQLASKYRTVFVLREVEGFSTAATAEILGLGSAAVKTRLHRARLFLRRELASYFDAEAKGSLGTQYPRAS